MNFEKYLENQECIVYSAKSRKSIYLGIFLIIFFGILFPYFSGLTDALFGGNRAFSQKDCLSMFAFFSFFGWALPLGSFLICAYSKLIITDKRIIIANGARGRIYLVPLEKVAGVELISQSTKGATLYGLYVYLLNQKRLHSSLYYKKDEIRKVIEQLKSLGINKYSDLKYHELHTLSPHSNGDLYEKYSFSYVLPILLALLFLIPIVIFVYAQIAI